MYRETFQATPVTPSPLLPEAPTVPATWVPCPLSANGQQSHQEGMQVSALCFHWLPSPSQRRALPAEQAPTAWCIQPAGAWPRAAAHHR